MKKFILLFVLNMMLVQAVITAGNPVVTPGTHAGKKVTVYTTAENTEFRLSVTDTLFLESSGQPLESQPCIFVDPKNTFQVCIGIGGAITDASAETFSKMPSDKQKEILTQYFDAQQGIGYTLVRTNIHSCDFSSGSYTYVNDDDVALKSFSIAHDREFRIPFIKKAMAAAGGSLTVFASPWSPPAWMKDNQDMLQGGKLKPAYYQSWADYFVKFINAWEAEGVPVWGITVQNEPMARQRWESCIYTAEEERDFIKNFLGPTLKQTGLGGKKLIAWDHNRDLLYHRASTILTDSVAAGYVWGLGFHWYEGWTGDLKMFENVKRVSEAFPDKHLIFTEGCADNFDFNKMNDWKLGEMYGRNMINDFNNGTAGWTDWNILLDEKGGPNHVQNMCFAPLHANTQTGELYYLNSFYYMGHFSKFIRPGAKRIVSASSRGQLLTTAFINTDSKIAVVVMNPGNEKISYLVWMDGEAGEIISLPHSIQTLVFE